ncbi:peptide synthetase [Halomicronema hongdechloris C2206]|uniref:Peptide synthetase n=1 Tax=Halomicronema hongdechloris C2206 TaxID=1641165 RepID=A0A1Z3HL64_9CYAN|nr:non-ribosomal peptide synthetase [Halomicronema hongdechloris]ASC71044.1 peptide synthetase [Halomicronema hongdechloris C2206]
MSFSTLVDLLRRRALHQPGQKAFTFLKDGEIEAGSLTYRELDHQSRTIAARLQAMGLEGERALLLYPPGLEYLAAFFGCLYAGVIAVPAYPPRNQRNTPRILAVVKDAEAAIALTTTVIQARLQSLLRKHEDLADLQWLTTDDLAAGAAGEWQPPTLGSDSLAFLQYTSGSTGMPKGVMLSHGNLLHNAAVTYELMGHSPESVFVSWLPVYHDMGLIGGILQPLYGDFPCILMPPASFLQRPYRWLQTISHYRGTTSGAPNFAYELCVEKVTPEQRQSLDLSSWTVAFNGAEPVRSQTLERFAAEFATCGFRSQAFYPCYGMAEATLMVSGGRQQEAPVVKLLQKVALEHNRVVEANGHSVDQAQSLVGCGQTMPQQRIVIAHPETQIRCAGDEIGEIWVSGPSVGQGYWQRPAESEQTFAAYLADTGVGPFLRTGDLGFLHQGELFITGRTKDLIIIRGRNLYPQDIELTTERSHPALRSGGGAAFMVEEQREEKLVVVQELEFRQKPDPEEVTAAIREAIAQEHEVQAYAVVLIKPGTIPKTSSGKIQRRATRAGFLAGHLEVISSSLLETTIPGEVPATLNRKTLLALPPIEAQLMLVSYLQALVAEVLQITPSQINSQQPISALGLDSLKAFELKNRLEVDLQVSVSISDLFDHLNLTQLAIKILAQLELPEHLPSVPLVPVKAQRQHHPLSYPQKRLWFLDQLAPANPAYNIAFALQFQGPLSADILERSLNEVIRRHEPLRTTFKLVEGQPAQVITPSCWLPLKVVDCQNLSSEARESEVQRCATQASQQPFQLSQGPLMRAQLFHLAPQQHVLLLTLHHIIADEWSVEVLIRELLGNYKGFLSHGEIPALPAVSVQYKDFTHWQRQWLRGERMEGQLAYWIQHLEGAPAVLALPTDHPRPAVQTYQGARQSLALPHPLTEKLKALSEQENVTLFMVLLAAFKTLLYRYTGQDDILVGSPIANRSRSELKGLIGFFVNTLVLRTDLSGNPRFQELLGRVRQVALGAYAHQDVPFNQLVEALQPERDVSHTPLFQVSFTLRQAPQLDTVPGLTVRPFEVDSKTAQFDLSLVVETTEQGLTTLFEYNTDLFEAATITRMLGHWQQLLEGIVASPQTRLSDLPLLTEAERCQILKQWNDTEVDYPRDLCIHQLFEAQVERTPDAVAVVFEQQQLTYRELNQRANQLAHYLQQLGVKPEGLVGICVERSVEMVIGLLGILKAGGAYVPLDPAYPQERLAFILADAKVSVLLTQRELLEALPTEGAAVVGLDTNWEKIAQENLNNPVNQTDSKSLAYAIYTSGSTGKPKGTLIPHRGLINYLTWCVQAYEVEGGKGTIVHSSLAFDLTITGLFSPLLVGRQVTLIPEDQSVESLTNVLRKESNLSLVKLTPAQLLLLTQQLLPKEAAGRTNAFIIGGENLLTENISFWQSFAPATMLVNEYGPTETVVGCCVYRVPHGETQSSSVPIGQPIANTQLYVLDQYHQPVPIGVPGELYIGGAGLGRGYLNQPELTAEKFVPNPFSDKPGTRLYKTGDLARYRSDGNLEFLGRIDHQVKVRGYRIELGEIEGLLRQHPDIREAVVVKREDVPGDQRLVAYVVSNIGVETTTNSFRNFLKEKLPEYMVPSVFIKLKALPLTTNGKIDRQALPVPDSTRPELEAAYVAPHSEIEQAIAKVWQEVLHLEKVGINDNFFDLGGHSLLMAQVNHKLQELFNQDLSVVELFQNPTINSLAQYLSRESKQQPSFQSMRDRAQKQIEAINRQKQLLMKQGKR